ncbi:MAG: UDP-N-acetylmuramoyl-L-alanine--D-glutamate ligase, partial [Clostridiales bacterium]|nr:UDP-N-acetylmuramoyl-L-alanine--D-glutamate ligase [Clostridiales bacterium]
MTSEFDGKKILVAGLGKSGLAAYDAFCSIGVLPAVFDDRDFGRDDPVRFAAMREAGTKMYLGGEAAPGQGWDFVVPAPGMPLSHPVIARAAARGAAVTGELELAWRMGRGRFAAITGTNGKTTTTTLLGEIFRAAGRESVICGNIGNPVLTEALKAGDDTWLITEVSSFQLETTRNFHPEIAVFLNLTPDHMDRHGTMEAYRDAKAKITANQTAADFFVYNADDPRVRPLAERSPAQAVPFSRNSVPAGPRAAFVREGALVLREGALETAVIGTGGIRIPGAHNLENALAAAAAAGCAGIGPESVSGALAGFPGVEHRLEPVLDLNGVRYVNDSKGTNPDAAAKAVEAVGADILLIAGGYDKKADYTAFLEAGRGRVKTLLLLGATAEQIAETAKRLGYADIRR